MSTFKKNTMKEKMLGAIQPLHLIPGLHEFVLANCFVAGGAVRDTLRNVTPKDYDIFFKTEAAKTEFLSKFTRKMTGTGIGNFNYKDLQFITLYTGQPWEVVKHFDWNVNMVWYDFTPDTTRQVTRASSTSTDMNLYLNVDTLKPLSALIRLPYLLEKGYTIDERNHIFAISFVAASVNLTDPSSIAKQREWMSSGGFPMSIESTVTHAKEQAKVRTKLYKALK